MSGRRDQSQQRTLRRYALAGNMKAVRRILQQRLDENPEDTEAREELERLDKGQPLRILESAKKRRSREATEADTELNRILLKYPEDTLSTVDTEKLQCIRKFAEEKTAIIRLAGLRETGIQLQYISALVRECRRRGVGRLRRGSVWALGIVGGAALLVGIGLLCHKRAHSLEQELREALGGSSAEKVQNTLRVADTSINRLFCPNLEDSIQDANAWLADIGRRRRDVEKHIQRIEKGHGSISGMRLSLRAEIERTLAALPVDYRPLTQRWNKLCDRESAVLEQQKAELVHELLKPLPPMPAFTGNTEADAAALRRHRVALRVRVARYREAPASYKLSPELEAPMLKQLNRVKETLREVEELESLLTRLRHIRTYEQYRKTLQDIKPTHYTPAAELLKVIDLLPGEENVLSLMRDPKRQRDEQETAAAIETLLKNGPTFTKAYPATMEQTMLMEEVFKAPSLERLLIEATNADGSRCIIEKRPTVDNQFRAYLVRSDLDPEATTTNRNVCWEDARNVLLRTIDARPLVEELQLKKSDFFRDVNLSQLLTKALNFHHKYCPALAQALVYHRLLLLISKHPSPMMTGKLYSPTMRLHAASFQKVMARHPHLNLVSGCWLENSPHIDAAEKEFAAWFRHNRGADYQKEIRTEFGSLMKVGVKFCGYIDAQGEPLVFRNLEDKDTIWYLSENGLQASPLQEAAGNAVPLSPIFTAVR